MKLENVMEVENPKTEEEDDAVKFYLYLLFNCFLFTNTHSNMRTGLLQYIGELDDLENLDWATTIMQCTLEHIMDCHDWVLEREEEVVKLWFTCMAVLQGNVIISNFMSKLFQFGEFKHSFSFIDYD